MNSSPGSSVLDWTKDKPSFPPSATRVRRGYVVETRLLELLTSRLCHDISGPIAAINNGIELLAEEDPDFHQDALALVGESARRASAQLQFYRFAYGFSCEGAMVGTAPQDLANLFFAATRIACDYGDSIRALPLASQKLACNLLLVGAEILSRGGSLVLSDGPGRLDLQAIGEGAFLSLEASAALMAATPISALTSRTVQPYFTGVLADALGWRLSHRAEPRGVRLTALAVTG
jgi:histidine phosphotransferase ChpT